MEKRWEMWVESFGWSAEKHLHRRPAALTKAKAVREAFTEGKYKIYRLLNDSGNANAMRGLLGGGSKVGVTESEGLRGEHGGVPQIGNDRQAPTNIRADIPRNLRGKKKKVAGKRGSGMLLVLGGGVRACLVIPLRHPKPTL